MFKRFYWYILSGGVILALFVGWIVFFADKYDDYSSGKTVYGMNGHRGYTLVDAYRYFVHADGFWDSEDYLHQLEDEMYLYLENVFENESFGDDLIGPYINILLKTDTYRNQASIWLEIDENEAAKVEQKFERKIAKNPPYVGMDVTYISDTLWGEPHKVYVDNYSGVKHYVWEEGNIFRSVYTSDGKVIDVGEYE